MSNTKNLCLLPLLAATSCVQAGNVQPSVVLRFEREPLYRGISESPDNSAVGASLIAGVGQRWLAGVDLSYALSEGQQQRDRSISSYLGYSHALDADWLVGATVMYRTFPNSIKDWNYLEWQGALHWRETFSAVFAYSPDYYDHKTRAYSAAGDWSHPLTDTVYLTGELGAVWFDDASVDHYAFGSLAIGVRWGQAALELGYAATSEEGRRLFGADIQSNGVQLSLNYLAW